MDKEEADEFWSILLRAFNNVGTNDALLFKKYQVFLSENWLSILKPLGDMSKKAIVICRNKEEGKMNRRPISVSSGSHSSTVCTNKDSTESELDLTGSPLEVTFDLSLFEEDSQGSLFDLKKNSKNKCIYLPVSVNEARLLIELYNTSNHKDVLKEIPPLWILCNAQDPQCTIAIGAYRQHKNCRAQVICKGSSVEKEDVQKFNNIKEKHLKGFPKTFVHIETAGFALYDVFQAQSIEENSSLLKPCKEGSLAIECTWSNVNAVLQVPEADSTCHLLVQAASGADHSGAFAKYRELQLVQALANSIQSGQMVWPTDNSDEQLLDKIKNFMEGLKNTNLRNRIQQKDFSTDSTDFDSCFEAAVMGNRKDVDFTDQLWNLLIACSSYQELINALTLVFQELNKITFPPFVYRKNTTTIGKLVRNMNDQPIMCPLLEGTTPLQLLLEIGVEKLRRDYTMNFVGLEMAPYDCIFPFLQHDRISKEAINCLEKLHSVLELMVICWTYLQLPKLILSSCVRKALKHYTSVTCVDPSYIFRFPVSLFNVKAVIERSKPSEWQASLTSNYNGYKKITVINLSSKALFDYVPSNKLIDNSLLPHSSLYFWTTVTCIEDDFPVKKDAM